MYAMVAYMAGIDVIGYLAIAIVGIIVDANNLDCQCIQGCVHVDVIFHDMVFLSAD
jgi:hypothetical protein